MHTLTIIKTRKTTLSLQNFLAKNQALVAVIAVAILAFAIYSTLRTAGVVTSIPTIYYYDLQTGGTTTGAVGSGDIIAHVFACNSCDDEADRFIAYVEKLTDEAKAEELKELPDLDILTDGNVIARVDGDSELRWVPLNSPEGGDITGAPYTKCEDPKSCKP